MGPQRGGLVLVAQHAQRAEGGGGAEPHVGVRVGEQAGQGVDAARVADGFLVASETWRGEDFINLI